MSNARCIVCDGIKLAAIDAEATIAIVALAANASLDGLKATMCAEHRSRWTLALLHGANALESIQNPQPEPPRGDNVDAVSAVFGLRGVP